METIYNFSVKDAELNDVRLSDFKNQIVLIVNVASYCGLTYQYKGLEKLYRKYQNKGFEILGFPCNQFAFQEPGTNDCLLYTSPSPRDRPLSRMPSSA